MKKLEEYVSLNLSRELKEVKLRNIANVNNPLSIEECTLIYKYTEDGFEQLNEILRASKGENYTEFGSLLDKTISKLPNYEDILYRSVNLSQFELQKYLDAANKNSILVEHSFISTSKSRRIAYGFGENCQFRILSRSAKDIEEFSKYGSYHPQNEKEVLFRPNCKFKVLGVTKSDSYTLITLEEVK
jgi:hypothetical protein